MKVYLIQNLKIETCPFSGLLYIKEVNIAVPIVYVSGFTPYVPSGKYWYLV